eukprot:SM000051S17583  [mRNA]  locus=s51:541497:543476:+ [translate_table: standard]
MLEYRTAFDKLFSYQLRLDQLSDATHEPELAADKLTLDDARMTSRLPACRSELEAYPHFELIPYLKYSPVKCGSEGRCSQKCRLPPVGGGRCGGSQSNVGAFSAQHLPLRGQHCWVLTVLASSREDEASGEVAPWLLPPGLVRATPFRPLSVIRVFETNEGQMLASRTCISCLEVTERSLADVLVLVVRTQAPSDFVHSFGLAFPSHQSIWPRFFFFSAPISLALDIVYCFWAGFASPLFRRWSAPHPARRPSRHPARRRSAVSSRMW